MVICLGFGVWVVSGMHCEWYDSGIAYLYIDNVTIIYFPSGGTGDRGQGGVAWNGDLVGVWTLGC